MVATAGADRVLTVDLHSPQIQGFFSMPADQLSGVPVLCERLQRERPDEHGRRRRRRRRGQGRRQVRQAARSADRVHRQAAHRRRREGAPGARHRRHRRQGLPARRRRDRHRRHHLRRHRVPARPAARAASQAAVVHPVLSGRAVERLAPRASRRLVHQHDPDPRRQAVAQDGDPVDGAAAGDGDHAHPRRPSVSELFASRRGWRRRNFSAQSAIRGWADGGQRDSAREDRAVFSGSTDASPLSSRQSVLGVFACRRPSGRRRCRPSCSPSALRGAGRRG